VVILNLNLLQIEDLLKNEAICERKKSQTLLRIIDQNLQSGNLLGTIKMPMGTIKIPKNAQILSSRLPKANYQLPSYLKKLYFLIY